MKEKTQLQKWVGLDVACKDNLNSKAKQNWLCPNWMPSTAFPIKQFAKEYGV